MTAEKAEGPAAMTTEVKRAHMTIGDMITTIVVTNLVEEVMIATIIIAVIAEDMEAVRIINRTNDQKLMTLSK